MSYKKQLQMIDLPISYFDQIIKLMESKVDNISGNTELIRTSVFGYENKKRIRYWRGADASENYMVIQNMFLIYILEDEFKLAPNEWLRSEPDWKQFVVRSIADDSIQDVRKVVKKAVTGATAWKWLEKLTSSYYSQDEISLQYAEHEADYDADLAQQHNLFDLPSGTIYKFQNCVYYDINGAHQSAIAEIFPECKSDILQLHSMRKIDPTVKPKFNYSVGMMARKGHRKTYNWIVQRTTHILLDLQSKIMNENSLNVYTNTDGTIIADPANYITPSTELGKFKLEYSGDVYLYRGNNYWCIQYGNTIKGNIPLLLREHINLAEGKVIQYNKTLVTLSNGIQQYEYNNVKKLLTDIESVN